LKIAGCTDDIHVAYAVTAGSGTFAVVFLSFDLGTIDKVYALEGNDRYELHVWPATEKPKPEVLRRAPQHGG
jgi:hypothetical protein